MIESGPTLESSNGSALGSPFQGLGFYTEADARWFFGRTTERRIILAHLRTARLTLLYAESGVGKSSLLRAGVAARLRELAEQNAGRTGAPRFVPVVFSAWKDDPVADLIAELRRHADTSDPADGLAEAITTVSATLDATLVIILDQFEEHFSYRLADSRPNRFADELAACINAPDVPANFLIAVREDGYGRLGDLFAGRIANVYNNYLHLEYLTRTAAREAIEKPVEIYNSELGEAEAVTLDPDLTDAVLDEVQRGRLELGARRLDRNGEGNRAGPNDEIETPFLQLVMTRLWDYERAQGSRTLRTSTLNGELGGAEEIVRNHVDRALTGLGGEELETATDIFHDLVTPSGAKVAHTAADLAKMTAHPDNQVTSVLNRLYEERIVRAVDPAPGTTQARYEIYHDRLAAPILEWRQQQENARLERARERAEEEARTQRRQARRFKRRARIMLGLAISLLVLLAAVIVLLQYARDQSATARLEKRQATYSGLMTQAQAQLANRPDVSLLLYLAAHNESPQQLVEHNLVTTLQSLKRFGAIGVLHGHTDAVESVAFSPVSDTLASASSDRTIRLWSVTSGGHRPLGAPLRANAPLYSVSFDPTGQTLASGSVNDIVLWSLARHTEESAIPDNGGSINSVAFGQGGRLLAAGGSDGKVLLWNLVTHRGVRLTDPAGGPVRSVAFSPDGRTIAAAGGGKVVLWSVANHAQVGQPLRDGRRALYSVAFSPDGSTLAATGAAGNVLMWDAKTLRRIARRLNGGSRFESLAYSPDGRYIAAGGTGPTVIWDLTHHSRFGQRLSNQEGTTFSVAFSARGRMLAEGGADRTITLWKYPVAQRFGVPLVRRRGFVKSVAVSPDGRLVASTSTGGANQRVLLSTLATGRRVRALGPPFGASDVAFDPTGRTVAAAYYGGAIRLWHVADGAPLGPPLHGHLGYVLSIAFDRSGTRLVSGGSDGMVRLWDLTTHRELARLGGRFGAVYSVAFSPNGHVIAAGSNGRAIQLWSARTRKPLQLIAEDDAVFSIAFSPDGELLAAGGGDDTIHMWTLGTHGSFSRYTLTGHTNLLRSVAFSPNGETLASGSTDSSIRLWDVATGTELGSPLTAHRQSVESVAFTTDGKFLVSGSRDRTVRLWQAVNTSSFAAVRADVCSFLGAGLSRAEWSEYAPNIPFQQTCPLTTPSR